MISLWMWQRYRCGLAFSFISIAFVVFSFYLLAMRSLSWKMHHTVRWTWRVCIGFASPQAMCMSYECWLYKHFAKQKGNIFPLRAQLWADKSDKIRQNQNFFFQEKKLNSKININKSIIGKATEAEKKQIMIHTHQIKWTVKRNAPGTTKSSEPTDHRRRNTIKPGIWKCNLRKWWRRRSRRTMRIKKIHQDGITARLMRYELI